MPGQTPPPQGAQPPAPAAVSGITPDLTDAPLAEGAIRPFNRDPAATKADITTPNPVAQGTGERPPQMPPPSRPASFATLASAPQQVEGRGAQSPTKTVATITAQPVKTPDQDPVADTDQQVRRNRTPVTDIPRHADQRTFVGPATPSFSTTFSALPVTADGDPVDMMPGQSLEVGATSVAPTIASPAPTTASAGAASPMVLSASQQMAAALADPTRDPSAPVELALDPPELGRVRLAITEVAGTMTLTIHAERPETVDLMRRHLDLLAQEFAREGVDAPSVRVSQDGPSQREQGADASPQDTPDTIPDEPEITTTPLARTADGALDLRL